MLLIALVIVVVIYQSTLRTNRPVDCLYLLHTYQQLSLSDQHHHALISLQCSYNRGDKSYINFHDIKIAYQYKSHLR